MSRIPHTGLAEAPAPYSHARLDAAAVRSMLDAGTLPHDKRVELIEGVLVTMSPARNRHASAVLAVGATLWNQIPKTTSCVTDGALFLADDLMLGPDLSFLPRGVLIEDAEGEDILLLIEISNSTLRFDLTQKAGFYAQHGVRDYWVVDLPNEKLHIHRDPASGGYGTVQILDWAAPATPLNIPNVSITLAEVLDQ